MYAKVMKKKKEGEEQDEIHPNSNNTSHSDACRKLSLIEINRASWCSYESVEIQKKKSEPTHYPTTINTVVNFHAENDNNSIKLPKTDANTTLSNLEIDHGYEAVNSNSNIRNSIGRNIPNTSDPNYETVRPPCSRENDYQNNSISIKSNADTSATYSVPFKHRQISNASSEDPGYEKVRLRRRIDLDQDTDSEPNYESMPNDSGEPNYAFVCRPSDSDTDPNYESVNHGDPNYESVKYMSVTQNEEPPYEQLNNLPLDTSLDGYEKVRDNKKNNTNYKKISNSLERVNNGDTDDEQYVQV